MNKVVLCAVLCMAAVLADPSPPNPKQFFLSTAKPGDRQIFVSSNWVDKVNELYRIDTHNDGELYSQGFYYGPQKIGYIINYSRGLKCSIYNHSFDILHEWATETKYAGVGRSILDGIECNMWNKTVGSGGLKYVFSYLASTKDNTPIELLDNNILISLFKNYTVGPSAVPKEVFDFPTHVDKKICK